MTHPVSTFFFSLVLASGLLFADATHAAANDGEAAFRDLYRELVEINTTRSVGSCTRAAEAMRARLLDAGIPAADTQILAPADRPQDGALVALLHGRDASLKPVLLLAHIDVVEARREDGSTVTFKAVVRLNSDVEVDYYRNGGILQRVLRKFAAEG